VACTENALERHLVAVAGGLGVGRRGGWGRAGEATTGARAKGEITQLSAVGKGTFVVVPVADLKFEFARTGSCPCHRKPDQIPNVFVCRALVPSAHELRTPCLTTGNLDT